MSETRPFCVRFASETRESCVRLASETLESCVRHASSLHLSCARYASTAWAPFVHCTCVGVVCPLYGHCASVLRLRQTDAVEHGPLRKSSENRVFISKTWASNICRCQQDHIRNLCIKAHGENYRVKNLVLRTVG